jgi:hypothetical protein
MRLQSPDKNRRVPRGPSGAPSPFSGAAREAAGAG